MAAQEGNHLSPQQVAARADGVVGRVPAMQGDVLLFSSGHFIRVLASRWIGVEPTVNAKSFMLSTASLSALGYERELSLGAGVSPTNSAGKPVVERNASCDERKNRRRRRLTNLKQPRLARSRKMTRLTAVGK